MGVLGVKRIELLAPDLKGLRSTTKLYALKKKIKKTTSRRKSAKTEKELKKKETIKKKQKKKHKRNVVKNTTSMMPSHYKRVFVYLQTQTMRTKKLKKTLIQKLIRMRRRKNKIRLSKNFIINLVKKPFFIKKNVEWQTEKARLKKKKHVIVVRVQDKTRKNTKK